MADLQIEIIKLRMPEKTDAFKNVLAQLEKDIKKDNLSLYFYYGKGWENDVALILGHDKDMDFPSGKSDVAHHICEALRPFGMIHHMVWKRINSADDISTIFREKI